MKKKITIISGLIGSILIFMAGAFIESECQAIPVILLTIGAAIAVISSIVFEKKGYMNDYRE